MSIEYIDKTHAKLVVSIGSKSNRVRRVKRITYKSKRDAEKQYRDFLDEVDKNFNVDRQLTVEDMVKMFLGALDNAVIDFKVMCELALFCGLRKSVNNFNLLKMAPAMAP